MNLRAETPSTMVEAVIPVSMHQNQVMHAMMASSGITLTACLMFAVIANRLFLKGVKNESRQAKNF